VDDDAMVCPSCGTENDDTADSCFKCGKGFALTEGALLASRYEILTHLGRGGMGIVYKARDHALEETVALKVLRFDLARAGDVARRFRSEIKLARKVRHPNVCGIHEYGEDGIYRFIVMELIEGRDLRWLLLDQGSFSPEDACGLAIEVSEGLQAIHDVGIVHRDLKSPNIMLDVEGRVRLMDFGIAKQQGAPLTSGSATATGMVLGTPEYMSPEQARGKKVDFRSDIYALGIIGYELFTGHVPFKGETPLETLFKHLQEAPVFSGSETPGIPAPIIPVLRKALAKDPEERYASARDMARALRQARAQAFGISPTAKTPPVLIATDRHQRDTFLQTQTVPTPTPDRMAGARPTVTPPRTVTPPTTAAPTPALPTVRSPATRPPDTSPPAMEPTRIVAREEPVSARPTRAWAPKGRRRSWILAAGAGVAGILWLSGPGRSTDLPETPPPTPAVATPEPGLVRTPGEPPPPAPTVEPSPVSVEAPRPTRTEGASPPESERPPGRPREGRPGATPSERAVVPTPAPTPAAPPTPTPLPTLTLLPARGSLQLRILPWAEVEIDGEAVGSTPMRPVELDVGEHTVVLTHPEYKPLMKRVVIRADETATLEVDLAYEAFPKE
jgi:serine/threonine-protein kinase